MMIKKITLLIFALLIVSCSTLERKITTSKDSVRTKNVSKKNDTKKPKSVKLSPEELLVLVKVLDKNLFALEYIIQKIRVLAVKGAHGTYTNSDRDLFDIEVKDLIREAVRIRNGCSYGELMLLNSSHENFPVTVYVNKKYGDSEIAITLPQIDSRVFGLENWKTDATRTYITVSSPGNSGSVIGICDDALSLIVYERIKIRSFGKRLQIVRQLQNNLEFNKQ